VSLLPCSMCGQRVPGKLSTLYWAWVRADGERVCWRQKLCLPCTAGAVAPLATEALQELVACPVCHAGTMDDMDPVYLTIYMPNQGDTRVDMACCAACAVGVRNTAMTGSQLMPDRRAGDGGLGTQPPNNGSPDPWGALGLAPR